MQYDRRLAQVLLILINSDLISLVTSIQNWSKSSVFVMFLFVCNISLYNIYIYIYISTYPYSFIKLAYRCQHDGYVDSFTWCSSLPRTLVLSFEMWISYVASMAISQICVRWSWSPWKNMRWPWLLFFVWKKQVLGGENSDMTWRYMNHCILVTSWSWLIVASFWNFWPWFVIFILFYNM